MVMTCIEWDVLAELSTEAKEQRLENMDYDMVFYADDTIVFSKTIKGIEEILGHVKNISGDYGLRLNKGKCVNMNMHVEGQQKLGTKPEDHQMKGVESAMYLGNRLNKKANIR